MVSAPTDWYGLPLAFADWYGSVAWAARWSDSLKTGQHPPAGVACAPNYPTRDSWFDMTCSVVPPTPKPLRCDSDEPARNDG